MEIDCLAVRKAVESSGWLHGKCGSNCLSLFPVGCVDLCTEYVVHSLCVGPSWPPTLDVPSLTCVQNTYYNSPQPLCETMRSLKAETEENPLVLPALGQYMTDMVGHQHQQILKLLVWTKVHLALQCDRCVGSTSSIFWLKGTFGENLVWSLLP